MVLFCKEKCAVQMNGGSVRALAGNGLRVFQKESWLRDSRELHFQACPVAFPVHPHSLSFLAFPCHLPYSPLRLHQAAALAKRGGRRWGQLEPTSQSQDPFPDEHITRNWVFQWLHTGRTKFNDFYSGCTQKCHRVCLLDYVL